MSNLLKYIEFKPAGICSVEVHEIIKHFTLLNRIYQYDDEYYLLEYTPRCKRKSKIRISTNDALKIIKELDLKPFRNDFFIRAVTYVPTT